MEDSRPTLATAQASAGPTVPVWRENRLRRFLADLAYPLIWLLNRPALAPVSRAIYDFALRCNGIAINFKGDLRDYKSAAQMLSALGFKKIRLLSNNPDKKSQLENFGVEVTERVSTGIFANSHNARYLHTKALKSGHLFSLEDVEAFLHGAAKPPKKEST